MIELKDINLQFGSKILFHHLNWNIPYGSRIALMGINGAGKTTLFRCIIHEEDRYSGRIDFAGIPTFGYLPQDINLFSSETLLEYYSVETGMKDLLQKMKRLEIQFKEVNEDKKEFSKLSSQYEDLLKRFENLGGYSFDAYVKKVLLGLGFSTKDFGKKCSDFSGGWKMRIYLAKILIENPDIMLLDEPTNHLDIASIEWLEQYLKSYQGTMIAISHDRMFLNHCVSKIAELTNNNIEEYPGNYDFFLKQSKLRKEELIKKKIQQDEWIEKNTRFIERFRYQANKASAVQSRIKMLDKVRRLEIEPPQKTITLQFPVCERSGLKSVELVNVTKQYEDNVVLDSINFSIERGEKVALVGCNGSGKSTLSRLLSDTEKPTKGLVTWGKNVHTGFYAQESAQNVNYDETVWSEIQSIDTKADDKEKRNLLGAFLFKNEDLYKPINVLSGGEKSRLALCKMLLQPQNLLILDEPGNHLDISTKEIFQRALMAYEGTLVIVSHDRFFLDQIATRIIEIDRGKIHNYVGNYTYYLAKKDSSDLNFSFFSTKRTDSKDSLNNQNESELSEKRETGKKTKNLKRIESEFRKKVKPYKDAIDSAETRIEVLETEKEMIEKKMCDVANHSNEKVLIDLTRNMQEVKQQLDDAIHDWERAQEEYAAVLKTKPAIE